MGCMYWQVSMFKISSHSSTERDSSILFSLTFKVRTQIRGGIEYIWCTTFLLYVVTAIRY